MALPSCWLSSCATTSRSSRSSAGRHNYVTRMTQLSTDWQSVQAAGAVSRACTMQLTHTRAAEHHQPGAALGSRTVPEVESSALLHASVMSNSNPCRFLPRTNQMCASPVRLLTAVTRAAPSAEATPTSRWRSSCCAQSVTHRSSNVPAWVTRTYMRRHAGLYY